MTSLTLDKASTLVIGGAGFVGSNLVRKLLAEGAASVTIVDNFLSADISNVPADPRVKLLRGSIADLAQNLPVGVPVGAARKNKGVGFFKALAGIGFHIQQQ